MGTKIWYWDPTRLRWSFERAESPDYLSATLHQLRTAHPDVTFKAAQRRPRLAPTSLPQRPEDNSLTVWVGPALLDAVYDHTNQERARTNYRISTGDVVRAALLAYFQAIGKPVDYRPGPDSPVPRGLPGTPIPRPAGSVAGRESDIERLAEEDASFGWFRGR